MVELWLLSVCRIELLWLFACKSKHVNLPIVGRAFRRDFFLPSWGLAFPDNKTNGVIRLRDYGETGSPWLHF